MPASPALDGQERALESLLFGVRPQSAGVVGVVTLGLLVTATLAAYLPAVRAVSVDPAKVLREE